MDRYKYWATRATPGQRLRQSLPYSVFPAAEALGCVGRNRKWWCSTGYLCIPTTMRSLPCEQDFPKTARRDPSVPSLSRGIQPPVMPNSCSLSLGGRRPLVALTSHTCMRTANIRRSPTSPARRHSWLQRANQNETRAVGDLSRRLASTVNLSLVEPRTPARTCA